jgi:enamine deaminase RidA (YjgF/YER057c/UK114 family)
LLRRLSAPGAHHQEIDASCVLGTVHFGGPRQRSGNERAPALDLPLEILGDRAPVLDAWLGEGPSHFERVAGIHLATDDRFMFGCIQIDETSAGGLRAATRQAYASIFAALEHGACRFPVRFWNYIPNINRELDGLERYRHFNIGRQEAFLAAGRPAFAGAPAGCAIGAEHAHLIVYFVAAKDPPLAIENPRQVSAYHYPAEHGPRSPTFSRAALTTGSKPALFISGTASVVGHRSQHPGDAAAQTRETFVNLRTLVEGANRGYAKPPFALERLVYTVYVRHPEHYALVKAQFAEEVVATEPVIFLKGDICRAELLMEIEATGIAT